MFIYDRNSFFSKDIVRWVDYALLFVFLVLPIAASVDEQENNVHFICIILGAWISLGLTEHTLKHTNSFIGKLGTEEAEKKVKFALIYSTIAFVLCTSFVFYLSYFFFILRDLDGSYIPFWAYFIPLPLIAVFLINILNIGSLFYPLFEKEIEL